MKLTYNENGARLTTEQRDAIDAWLADNIARGSIEELEQSGITPGSISNAYYDHKKHRDGNWSNDMKALDTVDTPLFRNVVRNGYSLESEPKTDLEVQVIRVQRGNIIETYLAMKTPNNDYIYNPSQAFARITVVVNGMNLNTYEGARPAGVIEYLLPGEPTYDMKHAAHQVYEDIENEFHK